MQITNKQVHQSNAALAVFGANTKVPVTVRARAIKAQRSFRLLFEDYETQRQELLDEYSQKEEKTGKRLVVDGNAVFETEAKAKAYDDKIKELQAVKHDMTIETIKLSELKDLEGIPSSVLAALDWLIEID